MSKKLMVVLALNNAVLGSAVLLLSSELTNLTQVATRAHLYADAMFESFSYWSVGIADSLNKLFLLIQ